MKRERIDKLLVDRGMVGSCERARRLVMAGAVRIGDRVVDKPGALVAGDAEVRVEDAAIPFVSRGGLKLDGALTHFGVDVLGAVVVDVGASTGGFTDCALQRGAQSVISIDVGYGQFAWSLRNDPRVTLLERTNIRAVSAQALPMVPTVAAIDVSFISLRLVLPTVASLVAPGGTILAMVKPQFEVERDEVGKGGWFAMPDYRRPRSTRSARAASRWGCSVSASTNRRLLGRKETVSSSCASGNQGPLIRRYSRRSERIRTLLALIEGLRVGACDEIAQVPDVGFLVAAQAVEDDRKRRFALGEMHRELEQCLAGLAMRLQVVDDTLPMAQPAWKRQCSRPRLHPDADFAERLLELGRQRRILFREPLQELAGRGSWCEVSMDGKAACAGQKTRVERLEFRLVLVRIERRIAGGHSPESSRPSHHRGSYQLARPSQGVAGGPGRGSGLVSRTMPCPDIIRPSGGRSVCLCRNLRYPTD